MRSDLHRLFDGGYYRPLTPLTVKAVISKRIRQEFDNGKEYYRLEGQKDPRTGANLSFRPLTENISSPLTTDFDNRLIPYCDLCVFSSYTFLACYPTIQPRISRADNAPPTPGQSCCH